MAGVGEGKSSQGSRHIVEVFDKADERPFWISVRGGPNCLAQALWEVKNTRSKMQLAEFVSKLRVYTISDQDNSGRWMRLTFPETAIERRRRAQSAQLPPGYCHRQALSMKNVKLLCPPETGKPGMTIAKVSEQLESYLDDSDD